MATPDQITELRAAIGEIIPTDGTEDDTMFSDDLIGGWIDATSSLDAAALIGWKRKKAEWAGLVNVTDGAASRAFSDLLGHANSMIADLEDTLAGPTFGRTRIGKIVRS